MMELQQLLLLAKRSLDANDFGTATRYASQVLGNDPTNLNALNIRALARHRGADSVGAYQDISLAIRLMPDAPPWMTANLSLILDRLDSEIRLPLLQAANQQGAMKLPEDGPSADNVRLISFYLPQFHRIPENDLWWGDGFTEWSNVRRAIPNFAGHYQPHIPAELGYYDLQDPDVAAKQAELARLATIDAFCYYYYWFNGKRLLECPIERMRAIGKPDFPYCICWANENWTKRWDGGNNELLIGQHYSPEDDVAFIESLLPHFADPRYVRVDGRPVLLIYRFSLFPDARATVERWRTRCAAGGLPDPYIVKVEAFADMKHPDEYGADAAVDFPPHQPRFAPGYPMQLPTLREGVRVGPADMRRLVAARTFADEPRYKRFSGVCPSFDNTARRQLDPTAYVNSSPELYETWLRDAIARTVAVHAEPDRLVFINAWNEWGEGNHLEPDQHFGRGWIEATARARERSSDYVLLRDRLDRGGLE
jgi:hypothetical protein